MGGAGRTRFFRGKRWALGGGTPSVPDADALVDTAESLKDEETGVLDEVLQTGHQEEVVHQNLRIQEVPQGQQTPTTTSPSPQ